MLRRDVLQSDAAYALGPERLVDGHRAVDESQLGRDERDVDAIAGQRAQRQQRLEPSDAAAGDHDARAGTTAAPIMIGGKQLALDHGLGSEVATFIDPSVSGEPFGHS